MARSRFVAWVAMVALLAGCGGGGALDGTWTRSLSGEGDVTMTVRGGTATFQLPEPRWPAQDDLVAKVSLQGETLTLADETGPAACGKPAPAYTARIEGSVLTVSGGQGDPCGGRRVVLAGRWERR
jgi:hypothetical protein